MKPDLDHLPLRKRRELETIVAVLHEGLAGKVRNASQPHRRSGKILKVILFGSYARGDWVEDHKGRYFSDYDLLVIVSHKDLTDHAAYWSATEDRLLQDPAIKTVPQIIVHTMDEVNSALAEGQYFFFDIIRDGVLLYDLKETNPSGKPKHRFVAPKPPDAARGYEMAERYYRQWSANAEDCIFMYKAAIAGQKWNKAAFELHQATEGTYAKFLLTHTLYTPKDHNIRNLRTRAEDMNDALRAAWPRGQKPYDRYFDLLRRAYVEARYSEHYRITKEELEWLEARIVVLIGLVNAACQGHLKRLKAQISRT